MSFASRSVLTVACEQTEVLLFDPISSKHIKTLSEAHEDCVNNIRSVLWWKVNFTSVTQNTLFWNFGNMWNALSSSAGWYTFVSCESYPLWTLSLQLQNLRLTFLNWNLSKMHFHFHTIFFSYIRVIVMNLSQYYNSLIMLLD